MDISKIDMTALVEKVTQQHYDNRMRREADGDQAWADIPKITQHHYREVLLPIVTDVVAALKEQEQEQPPPALVERREPLWVLGGNEQEVRDYVRRYALDSRDWRTARDVRGLQGARMREVVLLPGFWGRLDSGEMHLAVRMNVTRMQGTIRSVTR